MKERQSIWEHVVIVAIVLVLIQTFLDDVAVLAGWPWGVREILLYAGLALDVIFTVEFLTRLYFSFVNRRTGLYFWHERGWIDLLASIPLLLLSSGPSVLGLWTGSTVAIGAASLLNVLKVVKAIRIARVLRLLRLLKIFSRIRNAESVMAQRHVAKVSTIVVAVMIAAVMALGTLFSTIDIPSLETDYQSRLTDVLETVDRHNARGEAIDPAGVGADEPAVLAIQIAGRVAWSRYDTDYYNRVFGPGDFGFGERGDVRVFFDLRPINHGQSRNNLIYFAVIVLMMGALLLIYTPHFAMTISDPIHIMWRGMSQSGYNLEVKVPELYGDDEVYQLAREYNETFLPMKARGSSGATEPMDLSMDDVKDLLDG